MSKQDDLNMQLPYLGVTDWWNHGCKGDGINIWNIEENSGHGACTGQIVKDVAPNCTVWFGSIGLSMNNDEIMSINITDPSDGTTDRTKKCIRNFIEKHDIDIITASLSGNSRCTEWVEMMKQVQKETGVIILNAAANDGDDETHETIDTKFPFEVCMIVGALGYNNGKPKRMSYSSVGKELDFSQLILWYSGTSAATPCQAGMCALIKQRYGKMSHKEMYQYLKMISIDLQAGGHDVYTGWGEPILPSWDKRYITMTTQSTEYTVNGEVKVMDTKPVNKEGNVFVPVRAIAESLGYTVTPAFNKDKSIHIVVADGKTTVSLDTGSDLMLVNGRKVYLNFAPYIDENNRTLVPIRAIAETFGCKVDWIQSEAKVQILEV